MQRQLESRVRYFFSSRRRGREDIRCTLNDLWKHGRLFLVGGMLRDLALFGNKGFNSDLDFVIVPYDLQAFDQRMKEVGARTNRFGGYALPSNKWQVDVWPLERTWAHVAGHTRVRTIGDLRNATFFKCDAILYDLDQRKLRTKADYFNDIENKVLEINLLPNPNPKGNAVRALRYALMKGFRWGPQLSQFAAEMVDLAGWHSLQEEELRSFGTRYLDVLSAQDLSRELKRHVSAGAGAFFDPAAYRKDVQLVLPHIH